MQRGRKDKQGKYIREGGSILQGMGSSPGQTFLSRSVMRKKKNGWGRTKGERESVPEKASKRGEKEKKAKGGGATVNSKKNVH